MILPKYEYLAYFAVYLLFLAVGIYNVYIIGNEVSSQASYGFVDGWGVLNTRKDVTSGEWEVFKGYLRKSGIWYIVHITLSEIFRYLNRKNVPIAHAFSGFAFMLTIHSFRNMMPILVQMFSFYIISKFQSKILAWALAVVWTTVINLINKNPSMISHNSYEEYYQLVVSMAWGFLKCLIFSLSKAECSSCLKQKTDCCHTFINYCGYIFYLPNLIFGPVMHLERYIMCMDENVKHPPLSQRLRHLSKDIARILWWIVFQELFLHYLYVYYIQTRLQVIQQFDAWTFYVFGFLMGQVFHLLYVIMYGFAISITKFECMKSLNTPKCIGRICFYSEMWKNFDQGLYEFLFRYIYSELCDKNSSLYRKLIATLVTFGFIYIWHGMFTFVLIWTILNFFCIVIEKLFKIATTSSSYLLFVNKHLSQRNQIRLYGILGAQIFIPSALSNIYFFAGAETGNYYMTRTYGSGILCYLSLTLCCYCIFQCSEFSWYLERKNLKSK